MTVKITLAHYECCISKSDISELFQNFHKKNAKKIVFERLKDKFRYKAPPAGQTNFYLPDTYIQIANHAYSESVHINPLQDFREVEKWKNGKYQFPFYGKHRPLGIEKNMAQKASTIIKGSIGEIISGVFFEGYFQQRVLVRPINRYPDFIGFNKQTGFSYCEAKCKDIKSSKTNDKILNDRVDIETLKKQIHENLSEIMNDPELTLYLAFSTINSYDPSDIFLTVVEIFTKQRNKNPKMIPSALAAELTYDAITNVLVGLSKKIKKYQMNAEVKREYRSSIKPLIRGEIKRIEKSAALDPSNPLSNAKNLDEEIDKAIKRHGTLIEKVLSGEKLDKDIHRGFSKKIKQEEMEKEKEFDSQNDMYIQHLDRQSINYLSMRNRSMPVYKKNKHEFYVFGNALIGIVNKNTKAKVIDVKDKKWASL